MIYRLMRKNYEMVLDKESHKLKISGPEDKSIECEVDIIDPVKLEMITDDSIYQAIFKMYIHEIEEAIRKVENKPLPVEFEYHSEFDLGSPRKILVYVEDDGENKYKCYYYNFKGEKKSFAIINKGDPIPQPIV